MASEAAEPVCVSAATPLGLAGEAKTAAVYEVAVEARCAVAHARSTVPLRRVGCGLYDMRPAQ